MGDVNGDGVPDLVVANYNGGNVGLLLGNGNGTFQAEQTFALSLPTSVALGDFNGDGHADLAVADFNGSASVLLANGNANLIGQVYTIDQVAPFVSSINRTTPARSLTNATSVSFTVTFSKPVSGVNSTDFSVIETGGVTTSSRRWSHRSAVPSTPCPSAASPAAVRWG